jgi:hypothetical protein
MTSGTTAGATGAATSHSDIGRITPDGTGADRAHPARSGRQPGDSSVDARAAILPEDMAVGAGDASLADAAATGSVG